MEEAPETIQIRPATLDDVAAITDIYNYYIRNTIVSFEEEPISTDDMAGRMKEVLDSGFPWFVAEKGGNVIGYSYGSKWKGRCAYRYTAELTVYLHQDATGLGLGTRLYKTLFDALKKLDMHVVIGGISLPNPASVALHEKMGMTKASHYNEVGFKFGEWIDVGYWQMILGDNE